MIDRCLKFCVLDNIKQIKVHVYMYAVCKSLCVHVYTLYPLHLDLCPPQVNPERVGFYRVAYSLDLFSRLTPALSSHTLSAKDRLGLQNDSFAMVRQQRHPIVI